MFDVRRHRFIKQLLLSCDDLVGDQRCELYRFIGAFGLSGNPNQNWINRMRNPGFERADLNASIEKSRLYAGFRSDILHERGAVGYLHCNVNIFQRLAPDASYFYQSNCGVSFGLSAAKPNRQPASEDDQKNDEPLAPPNPLEEAIKSNLIFPD